MDAIQIRYLSEVVAVKTPVMRILWMDDKLHEEDVEKCAVAVPLETGRIAAFTVRLPSSPCWTPDGTLRRLVLNIDQPDLKAVGSIRFLAVLLRGR